MPDITEEQLTEWMALCDAATPGPWCYDSYARVDSIPQLKAYNEWESDKSDDELDEADDQPETTACFVPVIGGDTATAQGRKDAEFIAAARTAMPALIAALREARAELDYFRDRCNRHAAKRDLAEEGREAEREKAKLLRDALERCQPRFLARWFEAEGARRGHLRFYGVQEALEEAARVLKETE